MTKFQEYFENQPNLIFKIPLLYINKFPLKKIKEINKNKKYIYLRKFKKIKYFFRTCFFMFKYLFFFYTNHTTLVKTTIITTLFFNTVIKAWNGCFVQFLKTKQKLVEKWQQTTTPFFGIESEKNNNNKLIHLYILSHIYIHTYVSKYLLSNIIKSQWKRHNSIAKQQSNIH